MPNFPPAEYEDHDGREVRRLMQSGDPVIGWPGDLKLSFPLRPCPPPNICDRSFSSCTECPPSYHEVILKSCFLNVFDPPRQINFSTVASVFSRAACL